MSGCHYVLEYDDTGKAHGCPPLLAGDLNHEWQWDPFDPNPDRFAITAAYEYRARHGAVDFDYGMDGWLVSARFAQVCRAAGMAVRCIPVTMLQPDRQPARTSYAFMLTSTWLPVLDMERSAFTVEKDMVSGEPVFDRYFPQVPYLGTLTKAVVDARRMKNFGVVRAVDVRGRLVCTAGFKRECERQRLLGIRFVPAEQFNYKPLCA
jgi:hypothetical protein